MVGTSSVGEERPGKEQSHESDADHDRGRAPSASSQVVPKGKRTKSTSSFVPAGHEPGLLSGFGGVAGWCAAIRTKEKADDAKAPPMQAKLSQRAAAAGP